MIPEEWFSVKLTDFRPMRLEKKRVKKRCRLTKVHTSPSVSD